MKRFILLCLISLLGLLFTACGGEVNTTVELEPDLSGRRIVEYKVSKEDFNEYANVSIAVVDQQISRNCPQELQYKFEQTEDFYIATFTMAFSSIEDAEAKITSLANSAVLREISCYQATGVFCEGFVYEEGFEAKEVLMWLEELLVNTGCVSATYQGYIIDKSKTMLSYGGEKFFSNDILTAKELSYIEIDELVVSTAVNGDGTYNRSLSMSIQEHNLKLKENAIREFMETSVPEGGKGEWTNENGMYTHTVTIENLSAEQLQEAMQTYTHSEDTIFETLENDVDEEGYALLAHQIFFAEYIDFREYASSADGKVNISYVQENDKMKGELYFCLNEFKDWKISDIFGDEWKVWTHEGNETVKNGDGVQKYALYYLDKISLVYRGTYYFDVTEVSWNTKVQSKDKIETEIAFSLSEETTDEEIEVLLNSCQKKITANNLNGVNVEKVKTGKESELLFRFAGSDTDINRARNVLANETYNEKDDLEILSSIACFEEKSLMSIKRTLVFEESVNPAGFLAPAELYAQEIPVAYSLEVDGKEMTLAENVPSKITYSPEFTEEVRVGIIRETINPMAIIVLTLIIISLGALAVSVIFFILASVKKGKMLRNEKAQASAKATPMPKNTSVMNEDIPTYNAAEQLVADLFGTSSEEKN